MNLENEFIPYEQALTLKELGFDEPCFSYYKNDQLSDILEEVTNSGMRNVNNEIDDYISAPLYQQAFRWLYQKLDIKNAVMPLDIESQELLLRELIDKVSSKHLLV